MMILKKGAQVKVISGKDKGKLVKYWKLIESLIK